MQANKSTDRATWMGFMVVAFGVVGLIGAFATFAAQLPFDRAMSRSQAIDQAIVASRLPDPRPALEALRPALGDSAEHLLPLTPNFTERATAERARMLTALHAEAIDDGFRLRFVIAAFAAAAALFGCMVLSIAGTR